MAKFIVELEREQILLIASMVHTLLCEKPKAQLANGLLTSLIEQTDIVSRDPKKHDVGLIETPKRPSPYYDAAQLDFTLYLPPQYYGT